MLNDKVRVLDFNNEDNQNEIKYELNKYFRANMIVPVLGSGFTVGEPTVKGNTVPSGGMMKNYMLKKIKEYLDDSNIYDKLNNESFSDISTVYNNIVPKDVQLSYLKNHFVGVCIPTSKKEFLSIPFQSIYTLNIDDGIESSNDKIEVFLIIDLIQTMIQ